MKNSAKMRLTGITFDPSSRPGIERIWRWVFGILFLGLVLEPIIRRILSPTILTDDIIRLVLIIEHPLRELLFWPCNEHVAFAFDFQSWLIWQLIGHDLRLAPLAYSLASVFPWLLLLGLLFHWLRAESGSTAAAMIAIAVVAQSPFALEVAWWYSASSFPWAMIGIMVAVAGARLVDKHLRFGLVLVALATFLAPAATSLGHLAAPLAIMRGIISPSISRWRKWLFAMAALGGNLAYQVVCTIGGLGPIANARQHNAQMADPLMGALYAITLPARMLIPSTLGLPAPWCAMVLPLWTYWIGGIAILICLTYLYLRRSNPGHRQLLVIGAAMIYGGYLLAFGARAGLLRDGRVTEPQLIYDCSRYHALPLVGLALLLTVVLAGWELMRRFDQSTRYAPIPAIILGFLLLICHRNEVAGYSARFLNHPDQRATFAALHETGNFARVHGITSDQLTRIIAPALRPWNDPLRLSSPEAFPLVKLAGAPTIVETPLSDDDARRILMNGLKSHYRIALTSGACFPIDDKPRIVSGEIAVSADSLTAERVEEKGSGRYSTGTSPGLLKYRFPEVSEPHFLILPGLQTSQELVITYADENGRWRPGQLVRWRPSTQPMEDGVIDLRRLAHMWGKSVTGIGIHFTRPGQITLSDQPRLLR